MSSQPSTVLTVSSAFTGNATDQQMKHIGEARVFNGAGIEAGGRVVLGTATSADVTVKDSLGRVIYAATGIVSNTDIEPTPMGIHGPLLVTVANISNAAHTLTVYWSVKR